MLDSEFFRFESGQLVACMDSVSEIRLAVADSWLVEDGRARNIDAHFERFAGWVQAQAVGVSQQLLPFFSSVRAAIPRTGRWFPRMELHLEGSNGEAQTGSLYLRLRTAPDQLGGITLWTLDEPDPRILPTIKGPDLSLCMQLRRKAQLHGADEAVLLDQEGYISEGALSAIVWWRGDTLCAPGSETPWLDSITRREVFSIAESLGFQTRTEKVRPADLVGLEVWALSSLQGIRPVTEWIGLGSPVGAATHSDNFQRRLRMLASVID